MELTQEILKKHLHYDPETGLFTRIKKVNSHGGKSKIGSIVGYFSDGYIHIGLMGKTYKAHRLAWFYMYGVWPSTGIDHVDLNRSNNIISNLRETTKSGNAQNMRKSHKDNKLGILGVCKRKNRYRSSITVEGTKINLGSFKTPEEASAAYQEAKKKFHPFAPVAQLD